jgi:hypothetical protein
MGINWLMRFPTIIYSMELEMCEEKSLVRHFYYEA